MFQPIRLRLVLASLVLLPAASACVIDTTMGEDPDVWACLSNDDCSGGLVCENGRCVEPLIDIPTCEDRDGDGASAGSGCTLPAAELDCNDNDAEIYPGAPERCNNIDDNCNGQIDEGITSIACPLTEGVCADVTTTCVNGAPAACDYGASFATEETGDLCSDGLDNDCDGVADRDDPTCPRCREGEACMGLGCGPSVPDAQCACAGSGSIVCDGETEICQRSDGSVIATPFVAAEIPGNNIDDNCDGTID